MEFLFAIAGLTGAVWFAVLLRHGHLLAGCVAVLIAGSCFGHAFFNVNVGGLPLTADRLLVAFVSGLYVLYRWKGWADPKPLVKTDVATGTLIAVVLYSTFSHDFLFDKMQPLFKLINYYLIPFTLYWVARESTLTPGRLYGCYAALAVFGVYLGVTAVAENREWWFLVYPKYIASTQFTEFFGRGRGPFLNPVGLGIFLTVCLTAALMGWPRLRIVGRTAILGVAAVCLVGAYATLTRSVWMGIGLAGLIVGGLTTPSRWRAPLLGLTLLAGLAVVALKWESLTSFQRDKHVTAHEMSESAKLRPILAAVAWRMFEDRPLLGCGYGHYSEQCVHYLADRNTELPLEKVRKYVQHNVFLGVLAETGMLGLSAFLLTLGCWTRDAWRLWRSREVPPWARQHGLVMLSALAAYLVNGAFHDVSIIAMANALLFLMAGVNTGLVTSRDREEAVRSVSASLPYGRGSSPVVAKIRQDAERISHATPFNS